MQNTGGVLSVQSFGDHISLNSGVFLWVLYKKKGLSIYFGILTVTLTYFSMFMVTQSSVFNMNSVIINRDADCCSSVVCTK